MKDDNGKVVSASKGFTINNSVLKITSFTIDKTSPQNLGSTITLNAKATGGSGTIKYKFYVKQEILIQRFKIIQQVVVQNGHRVKVVIIQYMYK